MTTVSTLPSPPTTGDPISFAQRADAFFAALPNFGTELNLVAGEVNGYALSATSSAVAASAAAASAAAASGATQWVSGTNYSLGDVVYDNVNFQTYRKILSTNTQNTLRPGLNTASEWTLLTGNVDIDSKQNLTNKVYIAPREKRIALANGTITVNNGSIFTFTATANTTFTFNLPTNIATDEVMCFILEINRATYSITFPGSVKWSFGLTPALTQNGTDILGFYTYNSGSTWRGSVIARNIS